MFSNMDRARCILREAVYSEVVAVEAPLQLASVQVLGPPYASPPQPRTAAVLACDIARIYGDPAAAVPRRAQAVGYTGCP